MSLKLRAELFTAQSGTAALYAVLLLPFALLLAAAAVDVSGWNALRDKLQQQADRIAFEALSALPSFHEVSEHVRKAVNVPGLENVESSVFFPTRRAAVGVTLRAAFRTRLDFLVRSFTKNAFRVERSSVAQIIPGDFVIIMSDGASLRPQPQPVSGSPGTFELPAWGTAAQWPASQYFSCVSAPVVASANSLGWRWWNDWKKETFQRWATQSCFNPSFTPLKLAAIETSEMVLQSGTNRLAFLLTPGDSSGRGFRAIRHIHDEHDEPALYPGQRGGFPEDGKIRAQWNGYTDLERLLGDEACMMIAQPEAGLLSRYELPGEAGGSASCSGPLKLPPCGGRHSPAGHLSECYAAEELSLREAIYWDAAKLRVPGAQTDPDILSSLRQAWNELTDDRTLQSEAKVRGNFAASALRKVYVFSDFLPPVTDEMSELLALYQSRGIGIVVFPFFHEGLTATEIGALQRSIADWKTLSRSNQTVRISELASTEELSSQAYAVVIGDAFQFALRK